jgi:predicted ester cyclase
MSLDDNKLLIRNYYEKVVNTGNVNEIEKYISPSYYEVHKGQKHNIDIEGVKEHIISVRKTFPDLMMNIELQIAEGNLVVSCITVSGNHKGDWLGIKPTGKLLIYTAVNIDRIVNGVIVEHGGAANILEPLLEIRAIKIVSSDN